MIRLSIRYVPGFTKQDREYVTHFNRYVERHFSDLPKLLRNDYVFNPFNFLGFHKVTEAICSTANFVVLDVDDTTMSITERHAELLAEDLTHCLATTSDPTNMHKYRILFPLDKDVTDVEYRLIIRGIASNGLVTDMDLGASCKPAGAFYSYSGSTVLSHFSGNPLSVDDYMIEPEEVDYSSMNPQELLDNFESEFSSYRYATPGRRTKSLFSVAFKLRESGCTFDQIATGVLTVNDMFLTPKSKHDVYRRVLNKFKPKGHT